MNNFAKLLIMLGVKRAEAVLKGARGFVMGDKFSDSNKAMNLFLVTYKQRMFHSSEALTMTFSLTKLSLIVEHTSESALQRAFGRAEGNTSDFKIFKIFTLEQPEPIGHVLQNLVLNDERG